MHPRRDADIEGDKIMPNRFAGLMVHSVLAIAMLGCSSASEDRETGVREDSLGRALSPLSREIVAANSEESVGVRLLARLEVQESELVEFYELGPGLVIVSGAGAPTKANPVLANFRRQRGTYEELWVALTNNAEMPEELAAALDRSPVSVDVPDQASPGLTEPARHAAADDASEHSRTLSDGTGELRQAHLTADHCDSAYYTEGWGACEGDWVRCWDHVTGYGSAWHNDARYWDTNVCPYLGNVLLEIDGDESSVPQGQWTVLQNTNRWAYYNDWQCDRFPWGNDCPYIKSMVHDAQGDGYQYRFLVELDP